MRNLSLFLFKLTYSILAKLLTLKNKVVFVYSKSSNAYENLDCVFEDCVRLNLKVFKIKDRVYNLHNLLIIAKAKVICIDQATHITSILKINQKTKIIQLWHAGGAFKKVGFEALSFKSNFKSELNRIKRIHGNYSFFITSSANVNNFYKQAFRLKSNQILSLGLPRSDLLFKLDINKVKFSFCKKYNINFSNKIILYAPTFKTVKDYRYNSELPSCFRSLEQYGINLLIRSHPTVINSWKNLYHANIIDVSDIKLEIVLAVSDILITDFSSIVFDFSFFKRPIIFYCKNVEWYLKYQRNIYLGLENIFGSNIAKNEDELIKLILSPHEFVNNIWDHYMDACDGNSSNRVARLINKLLKEKP